MSDVLWVRARPELYNNILALERLQPLKAFASLVGVVAAASHDDARALLHGGLGAAEWAGGVLRQISPDETITVFWDDDVAVPPLLRGVARTEKLRSTPVCVVRWPAHRWASRVTPTVLGDFMYGQQ